MLKLFLFLVPKSRQILEKGEYRHGVARVKRKDGLYNFVNEKGRFLFKEGFHQADEFIGTHTVAGHQLINIHGEIRHYEKIEKLENHDGIFAVWHHDYQIDDNLCAFMNNMGELLTLFNYSYYSLRQDGTIYASYRHVKRSSSLGISAKSEESWYTILDSTLKEITPRLGHDKIKVNDSLQICHVYNENGFRTICLYDAESKKIISWNIVSHIPESGHYIIWTDKTKFKYEGFYLHEWVSVDYKKYGIVDSDMNPIINCIYDKVSTLPNDRFTFIDKPEDIFRKALHKAPIRTGYYFVHNSDLKGLYTEGGKCIMEPRYKSIKTKDYKTFIAETGSSIHIYSEEDGFVRVFARENIYVAENNRCERYFIRYIDPETGKTGIIDDNLNVILAPIYDSIEYNNDSFTAWKGNTAVRYFWDQYITDNKDNFTKLNLKVFPIENLDEINNRNILKDNPKTILFFDTETNGLPKDYNAPPQDADNWPRVLQLSWTITNDAGDSLKKKNYYIRPEGFAIIEKGKDNPYAISESILLEKGVDLKDVLEEFSKDIQGADLLVGHNIKFDKNVIQAELCRLVKPDIFADKQMFCTMLAGKPICQILSKYGFKYPKLQELYYQLFKKRFEGAHDSLNDVMATAECFFKMWK